MRTAIKAATLCGALLAAACLSAGAQVDRSNHRNVNGMDVYLGVTSAAAVRALPAYDKAEKTMHRGATTGPGSYHLNLTLLDAGSHAPIGDARVEASVEELGMATETKQLEPMAINGRVSYGNYFRMAASHAYWIDVMIERPGMPATRAKFRYQVY